MIFYDIDLCIGIDNQGSAITVKCCDTGVNIRAHLYVCRHGKWRDTHEAYSIPAGCVPVLKIAKPDNTFFVKDGKVDGSAVVFDTKPQAFTAAGTAKAEVSLYAETGERITTATFSINIPPECTSKCEGESGNYVDVMSEQIMAAIDAAECAKQAEKVATDAAEKAVSASANPPILSGKNTWLVWDSDLGKYVDTGVCAKGKDGDTPVRGVDYWTEEDKDAIKEETAEVFVAEYGVTTNAEMEEAYNARKALFCRDGVYTVPLYQRTNSGSFVFMSNDSETSTNRYCGITSGWNKKTGKLCATALGDIETALDSIIEIQNSLIGGE